MRPSDHPIDITENRRTDLLRQAERCRRLTRSVNDDRAAGVLTQMAREYEDHAARLGAPARA